MHRVTASGALSVGLFAFAGGLFAQCAPPPDTTNDTTYAYAETTGIAATPDLQFFKDAGAGLIHLDLLCNVNGTLRYIHGPEANVYNMRQGQTLNLYCSQIGGIRSTDWHVVGR